MVLIKFITIELQNLLSFVHGRIVRAIYTVATSRKIYFINDINSTTIELYSLLLCHARCAYEIFSNNFDDIRLRLKKGALGSQGINITRQTQLSIQLFEKDQLYQKEKTNLV